MCCFGFNYLLAYGLYIVCVFHNPFPILLRRGGCVASRRHIYIHIYVYHKIINRNKSMIYIITRLYSFHLSSSLALINHFDSHYVHHNSSQAL